MTEFKIESGIPIPSYTRLGTPKYPWNEMKDGDSFFVAVPDGEKAKNIAQSGSGWCKKFRPQFRCIQRKVEGGIRVFMQVKPEPTPKAAPKDVKKGK